MDEREIIDFTAFDLEHESDIATAEEVITTEEVTTQSKGLDDRTLAENFDAGFKIMGIGMGAVFGVLIILYIVIKIMGNLAKKSQSKDQNNEEN